MHCLTIRFYAELNDFLPPSRRQKAFQHCFDGRPAIKDVIESLGPPHTEVDLILVNGESVGLAHRVQGGEHISVFPLFRTIPLANVSKTQPELPLTKRFLLDTHLHKLAVYLRMVGIDAAFCSDCSDQELAEKAAAESQILLTRDRGLLKLSQVTHGYFVRDLDPERQLLEVLLRFQLFDLLLPFSRCLRCNTELQPASKESVWERLPERVRTYHQDFQACPGCGGVYWKGTHYERMAAMVRRIQSLHRLQYLS